MEIFCYDVAIRQKKCQNGISVTTDNVFTNVNDNAQITLAYGYVLTIISKNRNSVTVEISNFALLEPVKFNIPNDTFKTFDLPVYNGTLILLLGVVQNNCPCPDIIR